MTKIERTPAGLQTVIPGCERRTLPKSTTHVDESGQGLLHFKDEIVEIFAIWLDDVPERDGWFANPAARPTPRTPGLPRPIKMAAGSA